MDKGCEKIVGKKKKLSKSEEEELSLEGKRLKMMTSQDKDKGENGKEEHKKTTTVEELENIRKEFEKILMKKETKMEGMKGKLDEFKVYPNGNLVQDKEIERADRKEEQQTTKEKLENLEGQEKIDGHIKLNELKESDMIPKQRWLKIYKEENKPEKQDKKQGECENHQTGQENWPRNQKMMHLQQELQLLEQKAQSDRKVVEEQCIKLEDMKGYLDYLCEGLVEQNGKLQEEDGKMGQKNDSLSQDKHHQDTWSEKEEVLHELQRKMEEQETKLGYQNEQLDKQKKKLEQREEIMKELLGNLEVNLKKQKDKLEKQDIMISQQKEKLENQEKMQVEQDKRQEEQERKLDQQDYIICSKLNQLQRNQEEHDEKMAELGKKLLKQRDIIGTLLEQKLMMSELLEQLDRKIERQKKALEGQEATIGQQKEKVGKLETMLVEQCKRLVEQESKLEHQERTVIDEINKIEMKFDEQDQMIKAEKELLKHTNSKLLALQELTEESEGILAKVSDTVYHDRNFEMKDFSVEKAKHKNYQWKSPAMYTHVGGYKFYIAIQPNNRFDWCKKSLCAEVWSMPGEFDLDLQWPAKAQFVLKLINQKGGRDIIWTSTEAQWSRPEDNMCSRIAGFYRIRVNYSWAFIEHSELHNFLKNDALHFCIATVELL